MSLLESVPSAGTPALRCTTLRTLLPLLALALAVLAPHPALAQGGGKPGGRPPAPVEVAPVVEVTEAPTAEYTGLIEPATKVLLSAEVAGRLDRLYKKTGDAVRKNEVVAELDNAGLKDDLRVLQARLRETEAQVRVAVAKQERTEALYKKNLISVQQFEDGRLSLAVLQAKLQADRVQLARLNDQVRRLEVRSPIDGQVIASFLEQGQWITPNQSIYEVFSYDEYDLLVGVPGRLLPSVPASGTVHVSIPDLGRQLLGRIEAVVRHVDRATGNFTVRVRVANMDNLPLSGMLAKVRVPMGQPRNLLTVPRDAVVRRGDRTHVVVAQEDGTAGIVPVKVEGNYAEGVIVTPLKGDLAPGQQVVVRGNERLAPGTPLQIAGNR